eukprot:COSAG01_NODE_1454_length_10256_cov_4.300748_10_plen_146_part_00
MYKQATCCTGRTSGVWTCVNLGFCTRQELGPGSIEKPTGPMLKNVSWMCTVSVRFERTEMAVPARTTVTYIRTHTQHTYIHHTYIIIICAALASSTYAQINQSTACMHACMHACMYICHDVCVYVCKHGLVLHTRNHHLSLAPHP